MIIGWHTDNALSKTVLGSIPNIELRHINSFDSGKIPEQNIFYGILRGSGRLMHILRDNEQDYYYIDNGYFDALYVDQNKQKDMSGKFRVVKNGMHEVYPHEGRPCDTPSKVLIIPPSPYSANFYDTTPEDWIYAHGNPLAKKEINIKIRNKNSLTPLDEMLDWCDGVLSFNSMAVMRAIEMGKLVMDTHGVFRKPHFAHYNLQDLRNFYEPKQFTLEEFRSGEWLPN